MSVDHFACAKLYNLHVNDLPLALMQGELHLLPDIAIVYSTSNDVGSVVDTLNNIMDEIHSCCIQENLRQCS